VSSIIRERQRYEQNRAAAHDRSQSVTERFQAAKSNALEGLYFKYGAGGIAARRGSIGRGVPEGMGNLLRDLVGAVEATI